MKKILTIALSLLLMVIVPTGLFAEEVTVNSTTHNELTETGNVSLYANITSSYSVLVPKTVDVSNNEKTFSVFAKGDLDPTKQLQVNYQSGSYVLSNNAQIDAHENVPLTISVSNNIFTVNDLSSVYNSDKYATFTISHGTLKAGAYTATLPIVISIQNRA